MKKLLRGLALIVIALFLATYVGVWLCCCEPMRYLVETVNSGIISNVHIIIAMLLIGLGMPFSIAGALELIVCGVSLIKDK